MYANGYSYRRSITVDNTKVAGSSDLTDFPVLVSGTYSYLATIANGGLVNNASGYDIIFTSDAAGLVPLSFEIEKYVASSGRVVMWVKVPILDFDNDTVIYMFYGNSLISTSQESITNTWNSNYKAVYHLKETGNGTLAEYRDSTINANHGQGIGGIPDIQTSGQGNLGDAETNVGGTSDYINLPTSTSLQAPASNFTLQAWCKPTSAPTGSGLVSSAYTGSGRVQYEMGFGINSGTNSRLGVGFYDGALWREVLEASNVALSSWLKIDGTWNGTTLKIYKNGSNTNSANPGGSSLAVANAVYIGRRHDTAGSVNFFTGDIDEVRILNTALTPDWISTEYENQNSPSTFYAVSSVVLPEPTVTTAVATSVTSKTATLNGEITSIGGGTGNCTRRGFQFNNSAVADREIYEDGSFSTGTFSLALTNLTAYTGYYYRAFATNSNGTSYGAWQMFTTVANAYTVTIAGITRTTDILNQTIVVDDVLNDQQNTCSFKLIDRSGNGIPETDQEIIITLDDGTILFGGYITKATLSSVKDTGLVEASIECVDYVRLLDRNLVNKSYTGMTDAAIIADILVTYCPGFGITGTNVISGVTIDQITFNYIQPSQALRRIADLTGRNWYIDYSKDIHYFPLTTSSAPFNISSSNDDYIDLSLSKDARQIKNRVYVRGGTKLSDPTTYSVKGDGVARQFPVPDKPHGVTLTVNGVAKSLGIKNVDLTGFNYYVNFQEKYIEQDASQTILTTTDTLTVTYTYDIPILVAVENTASIITHGQKEFAIFDKSISTQQAARDRASAELTDYASNIVEGSFKTYTSGFRSGQYININLTAYNVSADYIVQKVTARAFGAGNYVYQVYLASAKTMGIIRFLIELLEANKNLIEVNDEEVVDNLLSVTDSLLSDSLTDNLTIDSFGPYSTWCTDSLQATPITRARWDLFQWG